MEKVAHGVTQLTIQRFVNVYFVEPDTAGKWVLIDTGLPGSAKAIIAAADALFYPGSHPEAILLTHGHMDHAGSAQELAEHWKVPIFAHPLELPFLTGKAVYPPADPTVDKGGSLAFISRFFPPQSFQLTNYIQALPDDSEPPFMPGWQWLHVPGHAPGQVAFFQTKEKTLLGADAFATANHESVPALLMQKPQISVAGAPFNYDWESVHASVVELANLEPQAIGCGHGPVIKGSEAAAGLTALARNFPTPKHGRYVSESARTDANGVLYLPPAPNDKLPQQAAIIGAAVVGLTVAAIVMSKQNKKGKKHDYADVRHGFTRLTRTGREERGRDEIEYDE